MFIISLTYKTELSEVDKHISAHISYLEKYYASGKFIASGRKVPRTGGVILVNRTNRDELDIIIKDEPFHIAGIADYDVAEFIPTMAAKEFSNLKNCI